MVNEIPIRKTGGISLIKKRTINRRTTLGRVFALLVVMLLSMPLQVQAAHINPTVIATIPVGTMPAGIAVSQTNDRIYVSNAGSGTVSVIDGASNTVVATIPVEYQPIGIAVNPITNRIYVANSFNNTVSVIDGANNTVVATIAVGLGPFWIDVNTKINRIYVSNAGNDTVSVIDGTTNTVISTITVGSSPFGIGVNPNTDLVYVANFNSHTVSVIDGGTNTVIDTIPVGTLPVSVGVNPITNHVYFALGYSATLLVYDGATNAFIASVPVGALPMDISVNPIANRVYVANLASEDVTVIDDANNTVVATITGNLDPFGVDVNPATDRAYIANNGFNTVSVIADDLSAPTWPDGSILTASNIDITSLTLSWTPAQDNVGVTSYKIYQNGTLIATTEKGNSYSVTGLTASTEYTFKIEACDATGNCSADGPSLNVRTLDDLSAPTWPEGSALTASNIGFTSLTLSWTPAQDNVEVAFYQIYQDGNFLATVPATALTYDVAGLTANTQYAFKVEACDAAGNCSADGPSLSVKTLTPQEAIQQLKANVNGLVKEGILTEGQSISLTAKLEAAIQQLNKGNTDISINQLQAFINEVNALINSRVLLPEQGQPLIDAAQEVINVISGRPGKSADSTDRNSA